MSAQYRIRAGEVFVLASGERKTDGDIIELDDDVAAVHATRIERIVEDSPASAPTESES